MTSQMKQQQLDWRRSQVVELASMGYSQREIARILQIDLAAVSRDLHFIRQQAHNIMHTHIQERMPEEYHLVRVSINQVLKKAWHIANTTPNERIKGQALWLVKECNTHRPEMITNGTVVSDALKYVNGKAEKLGQQVKGESEIEIEKDSAIEPIAAEETTINDVF
jgi:predicted transcriptional regulator